eukprot:CAMPEP_0181251610 /NCGR_PEP_ID=MMETSP1096-20121128/46982_1 /TAXON_ID=156174 ORGANISM="Chrysochromulina ericina, Strain CCMP281" /NCGR_SAMPLE_ID=MMETSP1096 /ASSEMBLY_ACC=CAM_ASM_000453 /LENGTH=31 /DNA_ID= /DNA_START= /DNA_END= /DNA_ORIENTATION=
MVDGFSEREGLLIEILCVGPQIKRATAQAPV